MKPIKVLTSACRYCRHYQPEGRRGGVCQQLSAPVQAGWKACPLAVPAFAPPWETLEDAWSLPVAQPVLSTTHKVNSNLDNLTITAVEETPSSAIPGTHTEKVLI
ncbi:hypothetical protein B6N60_03719 [Richelia sinica FACHB-800]|uniref:Uncharacterized protein n=1 Tax=Richelia sinica FACHB-800 TaxID=1357546 RepID=A0A975TAB0_9NOST|nr:hypothetical protein [Richelia sinica]MBD2664101.1 hypothetical protein [Richelia sinica FACHB-800]QXE25009.1 hypothetical protein B6N60_03719 [Richelia sinica FACHB-800]